MKFLPEQQEKMPAKICWQTENYAHRKDTNVYKILRSEKQKLDVEILTSNFAKLYQTINFKRNCLYYLFWFLIIGSCGLICFYQTYDRLNTFLSTPINSRILLVRNSSVKFPSITLCPGFNNYLPLVKYKKQAFGDTDLCKYSGVDLVNEMRNISTIWDMMTLEGTLIPPYEFSRSVLLTHEKNIFNVSEYVNTVYGSCSTYKMTNLLPFRKDNYAIIFDFNKTDLLCDPHVMAQFMFHEEEEDMIGYKLPIAHKLQFPYVQITYGMSAKVYKTVNNTKKPCYSRKEVNQCEKDCVEKVLRKNATCNMPYLPFTDLPLCSNPVEIVNIYMKTLLITSTLNYTDCSCPSKCTELEYKEHLQMILPWPHPSLVMYFDDNTIETLEEYYSYTLIPFLCDIGGNLGLFLGLSIPAAFEIMQSIIAILSNKIFAKKKTIE